MLQVAALNAEGAVAALVGDIEDMVVYLAVGEWSVRIVYSSTSGSLGRRTLLPDRAARVGAARTAGVKHSVRDLHLHQHQPQVAPAPQAQWLPSYLVPPNCWRPVVSRVCGSAPRKPTTPFNVIGDKAEAAHPCNRADL